MTHTAVVDLGFGDAGKGTVVDWLCATQPVHAVVRFNGGAQAAHNVVLPDGRHHTFAQFGSGTLHSTATRPVLTYLSRFMMVEPFALAAEASHLADLGIIDPFSLLRVDVEALVTTPYHAAANRARERARGAERHGSCAIGVGETASWAFAHPDDALRVGDLTDRATVRTKLRRLAQAVAAEHGTYLGEPLPEVEDVASVYELFADRVLTVDRTHLSELLGAGPVVFEGAQGVLLDEWRGFHPHTTWSTTTTANIDTLLADAGRPAEDVHRIGVLRAYTTRHGAGPMPTEDSRLGASLPEAHNGTGEWQGAFRVGHFDAVAHRYALEVAGTIDSLALTHLDAAERSQLLRTVTAYELDGERVERIVPGPEHDLEYQERLTAGLLRARALQDTAAPQDWTRTVEDLLDIPVELTSSGPTWADKTCVRRASTPDLEACRVERAPVGV